MLKKTLLGVAILFAVAIAGVFLFAKDFTVKISETTAQEALNEQIARGPIKHLGIEITLKAAKIDFKDDNTTATTAKLETIALGYASQIDGTFQSGVRYSSPRIYLDNITPVKIDVKSSNETQSELSELKSAARKFLDRQKKVVKSKENAEILRKIVGENSAEFQENLVKASYAFFERVPVYDLNKAGYKGSLASLALKDVQFSEDHATITLSPVQALIKILTIIGTTILAILWYFPSLFALAFNRLTTTKPSKTISGYVDVPLADRADFALALPEHTRLTNQETGCHYFRVTPDPVVEGRYLVEEVFDDQAAYDIHVDRTKKTKWAHVTRNITRSYKVD